MDESDAPVKRILLPLRLCPSCGSPNDAAMGRDTGKPKLFICMYCQAGLWEKNGDFILIAKDELDRLIANDPRIGMAIQLAKLLAAGVPKKKEEVKN